MLLYAGTAAPLSELGMQSVMDSAVLKLLAMIPSRHRHSAETMRQRLYLDPAGWYGKQNAGADLARLRDAVWRDLWVDASYETWEGERSQRTIAPYSLVNKAGRWYIVAADASGAMRTYRAARLSDVQLQTTQFARDPAFDIVAYWKDSSAEFRQNLPTYPVTLRIERTTLRHFHQMYPGRYDVLEESAESLTVEVQFTVFEEARTGVLGLGAAVEVIEPTALREAVFAQAQAIVALKNGKQS